MLQVSFKYASSMLQVCFKYAMQIKCPIYFENVGLGRLKLDEAGRGKKRLEKVRGCWVRLG